MNWSWEAIGALGQWAGSIATLMAVLVALRRVRPRLTVQCAVEHYSCNEYGDRRLVALDTVVRERSDVIAISVRNEGSVPARITSVGLRLRRKDGKAWCMKQAADEPNALAPGAVAIERITVGIVHSRLTGFNTPWAAFAIDDTGSYYYVRLRLLDRLRRWLWWQFGWQWAANGIDQTHEQGR